MSLVTLPELEASLDNLAWQLAQKIADDMPPYLQDDELTVERYHERNKEKMSMNDARNLLESLVEAGKLEKQERRRKGHGGSHAVAYVVKA